MKVIEGDFYKEDGMYVFTEQYHLRRGYCCGSGCRHCPYTPKYQLGNATVKGKKAVIKKTK